MNSDLCFVSPGLYLYLNQQEGEASGGAERQQYMLATELRDRGYSISAIVADYGQPNREILDGIDIRNGCPNDVGGLFSAPPAIMNLFRTMQSVDADVYYVRGAPRLFSLVWILTRLLNKRLIFCIANESDVDQAYLRKRYSWSMLKLYQRALESTDGVVTQTNREKEMLFESFGVHSVVIPNSYDLPPESELLDHSSREYVLWVGRSNEQKKKPDRFLQLAEQLPDTQFVMVAQPSNDGSHHEEIKNKAISINNLTFVDTVAPDNIHKYYKKATLLVNTSDYEGFPNTYLEAWRYRTPVVSLYHTLDGVFSSYNIGIQSGSMDQLIKDVSRLHEECATRKEMGMNAREYVKENHLIDEVVTQYEPLLDDIALKT